MDLKKNLIDSIDWRNIRLMILYCLIITMLLSFIFMASKARFEFTIILVTATYSFSIGFSIYFIMSIFSLEIRKKYLGIILSLVQIIFSSIVGLMIANLLFMLFFSQSKFMIRICNLIPVTFFGLFFGLIGSFIFTIYHLAEERRIKTIKLQQEQCRLELKNLIAQINPHFLFNTLNSIASLIHQDADKAEQMVHKLANMFRYCLQSSDNHTVQLKKEIEIITQYLEIEKIRFADRLRYQLQIEPECLPLQIPPLILQTLVENGVKHGISPLLEGGLITVNAQIKNEKLCLSVSDTGIGFHNNQINSGFGLTAVKNILNLLYGNEHEFQILVNQGTEVRIVLPKDQLG